MGLMRDLPFSCVSKMIYFGRPHQPIDDEENTPLARYRLPSGFGRSKTIETLKALRQSPETRLKETLGEIETKVCRAPKRDEVLVFGHTHRSFVNKKENVVNTGSWVSVSPIHNTFVELSPERISLRVFKGREISERI